MVLHCRWFETREGSSQLRIPAICSWTITPCPDYTGGTSILIISACQIYCGTQRAPCKHTGFLFVFLKTKQLHKEKLL